MHQVWQSKDLKVTGTEEEVREYERKQEDPMAAMRFPYRINEYGELFGCSGSYKLGEVSYKDERRALVAFANTGALLAPLRKHYENWFGNRFGPQTTELFAMHDKALDLARKVNG
jgi:hypothetical protein